MEEAPLAREDDWLRVVILEENRPQECEKRMRALVMVKLQSCQATEVGLQQQ